MLVINGINCQEEVNDYEEGADWDKGPMSQKSFLCNWTDRFTVANGLLGLTSAVTVGGVITLNLPASHPEIPTIFVRDISIRGKGPFYQGSKQLAFSNAIVTAHYGCIPWNFAGIGLNGIDPSTQLLYAKQNINIVNETKIIPGQRAFFQTANGETGTDYGFPVCIVEMEITLMHLPYLPAQNVISIAGNPLNSKTFLGCAPGTVFFMGASNEQSFSTGGGSDQNFRMAFKYRPIAPWDEDWNGSVWDVVLTKNGGVPFLGRSDLNLLLPGAYGA